MRGGNWKIKTYTLPDGRQKYEVYKISKIRVGTCRTDTRVTYDEYDTWEDAIEMCGAANWGEWNAKKDYQHKRNLSR